MNKETTDDSEKGWRVVLAEKVGSSLPDVAKWASLFGIAWMISDAFVAWAGKETEANVNLILKLMTGRITDVIEWVLIAGMGAFIYYRERFSQTLSESWLPVSQAAE